MKVWVAMDKDGLVVYQDKPLLSDQNMFYDIDNNFFDLDDNDPIGENITFENSPVELELVRK